MHKPLLTLSLLAVLLVLALAPAHAQDTDLLPSVATYVVQPGDSLAEIAAQANVSVEALLAANSLTEADPLLIGQVLRLPDGAAPLAAPAAATVQPAAPLAPASSANPAAAAPLAAPEAALVLALDTTGSMDGDPMTLAKANAIAFLDTLPADLPVALVTFADQTRIVRAFTTDRAQLADAIDGLQLGDNAALYDGVLTAVSLAVDSAATRRFVVLLTDSAEFTGLSTAARADALVLAESENVTVYTVALGPAADRAYLDELASLTGGTSFQAQTPVGLTDTFSLLRAQLLLTPAASAAAADPNAIPPLADAPAAGLLPDQITASLDAAPLNELAAVPSAQNSLAEPLLDTLDAAALATPQAIPPLQDEFAQLDLPAEADPLAALGLLPEATAEAPGALLAAPTTASVLNRIVPIAIRVDDTVSVASAELALNGFRLATFTEPPFEFDLDTQLLDEGRYTLTFTTVTSTGVVMAGEQPFQVYLVPSLLPALEATAEAVANPLLPAVADAQLAADTDPVVPADAPRLLLIDDQVLPFTFTFSARDGLTPVAPVVAAELSPAETVLDILKRPFSLIPDPIRQALTAQRPELWSAIIIIMTLTLMPQGIFTLYWMMYTWNNPAIADRFRAPKQYAEPQLSFTAILPARHEEDVIKDTIYAVDRIDYPDHLKEILIMIRDEDDDGTIARAQEAIDELGKDNIKLITFTTGPKNKPNGLNRALKASTRDVVCVFDAEDEPHTELYNVINTVMLRDNADVVQAGVQLMNFKSTWFSALNCLEYFFWFKSGLHCFTHAFRVTPLGGNTVFFKRDRLADIGGWDENCLTEDADVGIRLTLAGAKIQIVYDEKHATQEETPASVEQFIKQRTRWCQGFYEIFFKGDWARLPLMKQKITAIYILLNSLLMAANIIYVPLGLYIGLTQQVPVPIALISYLPFFLLGLQLITNLIGIREFTDAYGQKLPFGFRLRMAVFYYPYQLMLAVSAARAVQRFISKKNAWEKTSHSNLHRQAQAQSAR